MILNKKEIHVEDRIEDKNILFLCSWYPSRISPFNGNFIFKHARSIVKQGVPITALGVYEDLSISGRFEIETGVEEKVEHIIVYYSYPFRALKFWYKFQAYLRGIKCFQQKKGTIDLIHVNVLFDAGFIAWWIKFWKKTPYIITEHSTMFLPYNPKHFSNYLKPLIRKVLQSSSYLLPVSNNLEKNIKNIFSNIPSAVIPNVVKTNLFNEPKGVQGKSKIKFLHISNFSPQKNIQGILNSFKRLSEQRTDFSLTLAGDGDLLEIKKMATEMDFSNDLIYFRGKMTEEEVANHFNEHDAFVLFSDYENLPCVLVEAQVSGMPIIATDVGGVKEIIDSKSKGIIINARDERALLESLSYFLNNFESYNLEKIRDSAIQKYGEKAVGQAMINVYKKVLKTS